MKTDISVSPLDLPDDHPGVSDPEYRARRAAIAEVGERYEPGDEIPDVRYTGEEDDVWRIVSTELAAKHEKYAVAEYRVAAERLALPSEHVPQLRAVNARLRDLSGFGIRPVPGLVPTRVFYGSLADRTFMSTQYIRHHSVPFYTPEPDVVHELIGHCNFLADPRMADLYECAGAASRRATNDHALEFFSSVWWFSLEFGVCWQDGELRTYGSGLLSSYGEIETFRNAEIRPFDIAAMGTLEYDITKYQPVLFAAESFDRVIEDLTEFFSAFPQGFLDRKTAK
ncbi:MAG: phenylalanine 4-monooxygenase [Acidimicrobiales bacterium]